MPEATETRPMNDAERFGYAPHTTHYYATYNRAMIAFEGRFYEPGVSAWIQAAAAVGNQIVANEADRYEGNGVRITSSKFPAGMGMTAAHRRSRRNES